MQAGNIKRTWSCASNGKWITSLTAIVAPYPCYLVRGAWVLVAPAYPAYSDVTSGLSFFFVPDPRESVLFCGFQSLQCPSPSSANAYHRSSQFLPTRKLFLQLAIGATSPNEFLPGALLPSSNTSSLRLYLYNLCCQVKNEPR